MESFDFNRQFTPEEFEDFGCDIVEVREDIILERFKKNKDLGIDGRKISEDETLIVQCKRIENVTELMYKLKTEEIKKVKRLNPDRYILVSSSSLTVNQKAKIYDLFQPFIQSQQDIISQEDLQSYLRKAKYSALNKHYRRLILSKSIDFQTIIESIQNPFLQSKSISLWKDIRSIQSYFIETNIYKTSYDTLSKNHIIFLSGDAGSGKTTNAKMLLNQLLEEKRIENIYIIDSCDELSMLLLSNQKIGILYDDFWGSTFSDLKLPLNHEKRLQELLEKIDKMDNIYFILTTREYVLSQGLSFYKDFNNKNIEKRIIHKNCNYSRQEKYRILFAHAKNSNLDFDYLYQIKSHAKEIVESRNYSPRSINYFIDKYQDSFLDEYEFIQAFQKYLNKPIDFLKSVFYKLSEGAQLLAFVLSISNPPTYIPYLRNSFQSIVKRVDGVKPSLFEEYIKELFDFFITSYSNNIEFVEFKNHSIFDFINSELNSKMIDYEDFFCNGVLYFDQVYNLFMKYGLTIENKSILREYLIKHFDQLRILNGEDIFLDIEDTNIEPSTYVSHKIWQALKIAEKTNDSIFKDFLCEKIKSLLYSYNKRRHSYTDKNFIEIPELIKFAEKIGIEFCQNDMIETYLENIGYLFELFFVKYFPKSYQDYLMLKMKKLGQTLKKILEKRLLYELELLSLEGITEEYEYTIEYLPNILKMLKIPKTKNITEILEEYKFTWDEYKTVQTSSDNIENPKSQTEKEIDKFEKELFYEKNISKNKWLELVRQSSLKEENKKVLRKSTREEAGIWTWLSDSKQNFANFILSFYEEEERKNHSLNTTLKVYNDLSKFINDSNTISFLKKYAHDTVSNSFNSLSISHICTNYKISESIVEKSIQLGIIYRNNNLIDFSNVSFQMFLAILYIKEFYKSKEEYLNFLLRDGISRIDEFALMERFNAYNCNKIVLLPILKSTLERGVNEFLQDILNVDFENDSESTLYSDEISVLNRFVESLFGVSISSNVQNQFFMDSDIPVNALKYYTNKMNSIEKQQVEELIAIYFELLQELYEFLKKLKPNENFEIILDKEENILFKKF